MEKNAGRISQAGIRLDLVRKFRKQIRENTYVIKSDEIAAKMAQELFVSNPVFKGPQLRLRK